MKGWRGVAILAIVVLAVGAYCCDPHHDQLQQITKETEENTKLCKERGGIPKLADPSYDDVGHNYRRWERCDFPGQPAQLKGEGK
jgi:hypothetical protein